MSAQNTTLHLATTYSCDDNNCHEELVVHHHFPYAIVKPEHFEWTSEINARTTNDKRNTARLHLHGWTTHTTLDRNRDQVLATHHYCPKHQPPTWARQEP